MKYQTGDVVEIVGPYCKGMVASVYGIRNELYTDWEKELEKCTHPYMIRAINDGPTISPNSLFRRWIKGNIMTVMENEIQIYANHN